MWPGVLFGVCFFLSASAIATADKEAFTQIDSPTQSQSYDGDLSDENSLDSSLESNDWVSEQDRNIVMTKRFLSLFRNRAAPKSEGYKRGPGFRSWGGKRTEQPPYIRKLLNWEVKRKFSSWGGKRSQDDFVFQKKLFSKKKPAFHSWGGKRATNEEDNMT